MYKTKITTIRDSKEFLKLLRDSIHDLEFSLGRFLKDKDMFRQFNNMSDTCDENNALYVPEKVYNRLCAESENYMAVITEGILIKNTKTGEQYVVFECFSNTVIEMAVDYVSIILKKPLLFDDMIENIHHVVINDNKGYGYRRHMYNKPLEDIHAMNQYVTYDNRTNQIRYVKNIHEKLEGNDEHRNFSILSDLKDILRFTSSDFMKTYKNYPFDIKLMNETVKPNSSKIIRQMAEVGNIRDIFLNINEDFEIDNILRKQENYSDFNAFGFEGDPTRVVINERLDVGGDEYIENHARITGHYLDVQAFVQTPNFHMLYNSKNDVQVTFKNEINGMVKLDIYERNILKYIDSYNYYNLEYDRHYFNQTHHLIINDCEIQNLNDIQLNRIENRLSTTSPMNSKSMYRHIAEQPEFKLKFVNFRKYLEQI